MSVCLGACFGKGNGVALYCWACLPVIPCILLAKATRTHVSMCRVVERALRAAEYLRDFDRLRKDLITPAQFKSGVKAMHPEMSEVSRHATAPQCIREVSEVVHSRIGETHGQVQR